MNQTRRSTGSYCQNNKEQAIIKASYICQGRRLYEQQPTCSLSYSRPSQPRQCRTEAGLPTTWNRLVTRRLIVDPFEPECTYRLFMFLETSHAVSPTPNYVYTGWHKKRELLKNPTKIEEIQEKKCIDRNWTITTCLLRDRNPNYQCLKITSCRWRLPPRIHSFTATTHFKSSRSFVSLCVCCMLCRMRRSSLKRQD